MDNFKVDFLSFIALYYTVHLCHCLTHFCHSFCLPQLHTDLDKGDSGVKYTLSGDGAGTIFTIDQTTGDIHALRSLDREEKPYYTLRAQAVDIDTNRPLEPESEFVIKVQDINDNEPKFLEGPYTASVPEMSPVGKKLVKMVSSAKHGWCWVLGVGIELAKPCFFLYLCSNYTRFNSSISYELTTSNNFYNIYYSGIMLVYKEKI